MNEGNSDPPSTLRISLFHKLRQSKNVLLERISEGICEQKGVIEVPNISSKEQILQRIRGQFLRVPLKIEQFVDVPKMVCQDRIWQRTFKHFVDTTALQVVVEPVFKDFLPGGDAARQGSDSRARAFEGRAEDGVSSRNPATDCRADRRHASVQKFFFRAPKWMSLKCRGSPSCPSGTNF